MSIDAMKQMAEAVEADLKLFNIPYTAKMLEALSALRLAIEQAEKQEPVADDAYDMIDRFLRNNLDDTDYAEYSDALDRLYTAPPQRQPLTEEEIKQMWPRESLVAFARAIERAHGIT